MKLPPLSARNFRSNRRSPSQPQSNDELSLARVYTAYERRGLNDIQKMQLTALQQDINELVQEATCIVDNGNGLTNSSAAYYRDQGSQAASAKRGTAIHAETYALLRNQSATLRAMGIEIERAQPTGGRTDIHAALGNGTIAIFDITSRNQVGHIDTRGYDQGRNVVYVGEVTYDDRDARRC